MGLGGGLVTVVLLASLLGSCSQDPGSDIERLCSQRYGSDKQDQERCSAVLTCALKYQRGLLAVSHKYTDPEEFIGTQDEDDVIDFRNCVDLWGWDGDGAPAAT